LPISGTHRGVSLTGVNGGTACAWSKAFPEKVFGPRSPFLRLSRRQNGVISVTPKRRGYPMNLTIFSVAALIAALGAAPRASASLLDVTYAGTIEQKLLNYGSLLFNTGDPYTVTFLLDTTVGNEGAGQWRGGAALGSPSPILNIAITINDNTLSFDSSVYGYMYLDGGNLVSFGESGNYNGEVLFQIANNNIPSFVGVPYVYHFSSTDIVHEKSFEFGISDPTNTYETTYGNAYVNFSTLSISEVPEISTWAMMLIGFAGLGFAGHRASRKTAALTA
jgi:hypothetical protein